VVFGRAMSSEDDLKTLDATVVSDRGRIDVLSGEVGDIRREVGGINDKIDELRGMLVKMVGSGIDVTNQTQQQFPVSNDSQPQQNQIPNQLPVSNDSHPIQHQSTEHEKYDLHIPDNIHELDPQTQANIRARAYNPFINPGIDFDPEYHEGDPALSIDRENGTVQPPVGHNTRDKFFFQGNYREVNYGNPYMYNTDYVNPIPRVTALFKNYTELPNNFPSTILKLWQSKPLKDDPDSFAVWDQVFAENLIPLGLEQIHKMNPWAVPYTTEGWAKFDDQTRACGHYSSFAKQFFKFKSTSRLNAKHVDNMLLNASFLVNIDNRRLLGPNVLQSTLSTIDRESMGSLFPQFLERDNVTAVRNVYFNIVRHFVNDTSRSVNQRMKKFHTFSVTIRDSPKLAMIELKKQARTINLISKKEVITEFNIETMFKLAFNDLYGDDSKYATQLLLHDELNDYDTDSKKQRSFEVLVKKWQTAWESNSGDFNATSPVYVNSAKVSKQHFKEKKKAKLGTDGKPICFQYARDKTCSFGKECKFSHKVENRKALMLAYSVKEMIEKSKVQHDAMVANIKRQTLKNFKKKWRPSRPKVKHTSNNPPQVQKAIDSLNLAKGESVDELKESSAKEEHNESSGGDSVCSSGYSSQASSDSDE